MPNGELWDELFDIGLLKKGHFLLNDRNHTDTYIDKELLYSYPLLTQKICKAMATCIGQHFEPDTIVAPALGGIILGNETTRIYSEVFARRVHPRFGIVFKKKEFKIRPDPADIIRGKKVLIVDDTISLGATIREVDAIVKMNGGKVIGAVGLFNRFDITANALGLPKLVSLFDMKGHSYIHGNCPGCSARHVLLDKPGRVHVEHVLAA